MEINFSQKFFTENIITYLGNKRRLLEFIDSGIKMVMKNTKQKQFRMMDGFAGSGIVSRLFKYYASELYTNDFEGYCYTINSCYLANKSDVPHNIYESIDFLNKNKSEFSSDGIISKLYSPKDDRNIKKDERVFYTSENAKIIDNIRRLIDTNIHPSHRIYTLAPLLISASIHNNTSGVFKGFHKKNGIGHFGGAGENALKRIKGEIILNYPIFSDIECPVYIYQEDINKLIKNLNSELDIVYYDPPYNQHPYGSNYFMLNIINDYIEPGEMSKVSGIPKNWKKSKYNKKDEAIVSMEELIKNTPSKFIMISYNNEGIIPIKTFEEILNKYGKPRKIEKEYNAYKGSRNLADRDKHVMELLWILKKD